MDGTGLLFQDFVEALGANVRAVVVSYPKNQPLDYAALESMVRRQLPADESYVLLAESFSGPVAISIAASDARGLLGVVLCCSFPRNPQPLLSTLGALVPFAPIKQLSGVCSPLLFGRYGSPELRQKLKHALADVSSVVLRARIHAVLTVDVSAMLSRIKVPVLYLRATADKLVPQKAGELVTKFAPEVRLVDIEGPHFLLQAAPEAAAHVVKEFVESLLGHDMKARGP
jgi:pimeloyl-ACP methyl ester carboxylesterase